MDGLNKNNIKERLLKMKEAIYKAGSDMRMTAGDLELYIEMKTSGQVNESHRELFNYMNQQYKDFSVEELEELRHQLLAD